MTESKEARFPVIGFLLLSTLLALGVRIYTAGWGGLSHDEALCANIATTDTWGEMFDCIEHDGNPPLFYVVLRLWSLVFGGSDLSFRLLSVLIATAIVPLSYLLLRKQLGEKLSTQIAVLFIFCAPLVHFGTLVRGYGLLPILSLLATHQLIRLLNGPDRRLEQFKYGLLMAIIVYLHHWGAILAIGHVSLVLVGWLRKWWKPEQIKSWVIASAGAFLAYLPWAIVLYRQLNEDVSPWIIIPTWQQCLFYSPVQGVAGYQYSPEWLYNLNGLWANIAIWFSLLIPATVPSADPELPDFKSRHFQIVSAGGLGAAMLISQVRSIWRDRYLTTFTPLLLINYSVVCDRLTKRFPPWLSWSLPVFIWLLTWLPQLQYFNKFPESAGWALTEYISRQTDVTHDLVVVSSEAIAPQMDRYLPKDIAFVSFPDLERVHIYRWAGADRRIRDEGSFEKLIGMMQRVLNSGGKIWLIEAYYKYRESPLNCDLHGVPFYKVEIIRMCQIRTWLQQHAVKDDKHDICAPGREFPIRASLFLPKRS